jgi:hypothetical protein
MPANESTPSKGQEATGDRGTVTVPVEVSTALINLIRTFDDCDDLEDWVAEAVEIRAREKLKLEKHTVEATIPEDVVRKAELIEQHDRALGRDTTYSFDDAVQSMIRLEYRNEEIEPGE